MASGHTATDTSVPAASGDTERPSSDSGAAPSTADTWVAVHTAAGDTADTADTGAAGLTLGALRFSDGRVPTNLLVVSLDTTRRDYVGRFAGTDTTPNLDAILDEAVVLEDHRSCSNWTGPSMTCIVSGRTPMQYDFWPWVFDDPGFSGQPPAYYTPLSTHLHDLGYATALVTANSAFGYLIDIEGTFDHRRLLDYAPATDVAVQAVEHHELLAASGQPWHQHIHFMDPHSPYCPDYTYVDPYVAGDFAGNICEDSLAFTLGYWVAAPSVQASFLQKATEVYRAGIEEWDVAFGALWDELEARGALDDTLVLFVTDHGEQWAEHGAFSHGQTLHAEENRSTAAFWAQTLRPGVHAGTTTHQDLAATLYALYGITTVRPTEGLAVGTAPEDRAVYAMNTWGTEMQLAVIADGHQLQYDWFGARRLYDLDADPENLHDIYDPTAPVVATLWVHMDALIADVRDTWPHLDPPVAPGP